MLAFTGAPEELIRVVDPRYADDARADFTAYVVTTLQHNPRVGGRFNPPGEFGALYMTSDEATAWAELHARFLREGVPGLPSRMGVLRVLLRAGRFVDLTDANACAAWGVLPATLVANHPPDEEREACWRVARDIRSVADFLRAPSARAAGSNVPLFVRGRRDSEWVFELIAADAARVTPESLRQVSTESWDD
ncbi:MAG: RES family NAD+ phosphorylase [Gemmatimonadaceae bacterium]|jgi:RES domain-containing protein|nr:RES family NAD+ phosphorylase [Gemmatimonadaceae bacterium]